MSPAITTVTTSSAAIMVRARTVPLPSSGRRFLEVAFGAGHIAALFTPMPRTVFSIVFAAAFNAGVGIRP